MTHCNECLKSFSCDNTPQCWCIELPHILPVSTSSTCLCKACLIKAIRQYIESQSNTKIQSQLKLAAPYRHSRSFIEGLDYDLEDGLMIMTRWAHLKRGKCCGNGCRHCPFTSH